MKKIYIVLLILLGVAGKVAAQESSLNKGFGFGYQLNQYQKDFGLGVSVTSPLLVHSGLAIRSRGNLMFYEHVKDGEFTWTPYFNATLGLVGIGGYVGENIRLYGEGGLLAILPHSDFSSESLNLGGYGLFGFEFFMFKSFNYFIEIGGAGSGATADRIPNKPIYSNGLTISTGFRGYLSK